MKEAYCEQDLHFWTLEQCQIGRELAEVFLPNLNLKEIALLDLKVF